jgi:hypothetical protein
MCSKENSAVFIIGFWGIIVACGIVSTIYKYYKQEKIKSQQPTSDPSSIRDLDGNSREINESDYSKEDE